MSVFIAYHCPCVDGSYAATAAYFFFKEMANQKRPISEFISYIESMKEFNPEKEIEPFLKLTIAIDGKTEEKTDSTEETKLPLDTQKDKDKDKLSNTKIVTATIDNLYFVPAKLNAAKKIDYDFEKFGTKHLADSVMFMLDYYGGRENMLAFCEMFKKVVIIDHHLTLQVLLSEMKEKPANLVIYYDETMSGATLSIKFFEKIGEKPLIKDSTLYGNFMKTALLVEDHDIKAGKLKDSEEFIAGYRALKLCTDALINPDMFEQLARLDSEKLIEMGQVLLEGHLKMVEEIAKTRQLVYIGGKSEEGKSKLGVACYACKCKESAIWDLLANKLARMSFEDGHSNMGLVYPDAHYPILRVSLRSAKDLPEGDCQTVASHFKGGGHFNSAGFHIDSKELKTWFETK